MVELLSRDSETSLKNSKNLQHGSAGNAVGRQQPW
jgi:hypothetical protein